MLKLYGAREKIDKERFIYDNLSGEAYVLVPNQYTLVAEEQALKYTGESCLYDIEILSMNRLGMRVLAEQGVESTRMLDKYGRFMLLTHIIKAHRDQMDIYANVAGKVTFTNMLNDFISQFKQQDCTLEELKDMLGDDSADQLLRDKLAELEIVMLEYEKSIEGKYTDTEDYVSGYVEAMATSKLLADREIWIYGYDSITPKFMNAMLQMAGNSRGVHFVVSESDFPLGTNLTARLSQEAAARGIEFSHEDIGDEYAAVKADTIARIERGLWCENLSEEERADNADYIPEGLTVLKAANPYSEAESAAAYIYHLIRDCGYQLKDIQIIANDEGVMQPIIRRCFEEYGLKIFLDQTRSIKDSAPVSFIAYMLAFVRYREGTQYLLSMLKTGFAGVDRNLVEDLENYARQYRIKGSMWTRQFKYGVEEYGPEKFAELEMLRQQVVTPLVALAELAKGRTVGEFVREFKQFLEDEWNLSERVGRAVMEQEAAGLHEEALRNHGSYNKAIELLDQMIEIMGDEPLEMAEFLDIYLQGLGGVEVGVIPPSVDGLSMGTMIRTRPRPARAVVVLGANEGTLPLQPSPEGLFSVDEKAYFRSRGFALGDLDDIKVLEENVAMYRMLSKPSEKLYISYSMTDADGGDTAPSPVIDTLTELFPMLKKANLIQDDIISSGWKQNLISSPGEAMRHMINHLKDKNGDKQMDGLTQSLIRWYEENDPELLDDMLTAAQDENDPKALGQALASRLYARRDGSIGLSASAIGNYFDCPFKYYIDRGLRPREERVYASDPRSIGDVYHECLMRIADKIMKDRKYGVKLTECSTEELEKIVSQEMSEIAAAYDGGLFVSSDNEEYRMGRIREICAGAVRAIAKQLSSESVTAADFEAYFGRGGHFKPIEMNIEGQKVYVEGKIDRADILHDEEAGSDRVRIIDYKTGKDKLDSWNMSHGYKMQLMIYMISATTGDYEPAGIFYFNIGDRMQSFNGVDENAVDKKTGKLKGEVEAADLFKLSGLFVDEPGVFDQMPPEVIASEKDGISRDDFDQLKSDVMMRINEIAGGIVAGRIEIRPFKPDKKLVCNYCQYRSICRRDREYSANRGREIPSKPKAEKQDKKTTKKSGKKES